MKNYYVERNAYAVKSNHPEYKTLRELIENDQLKEVMNICFGKLNTSYASYDTEYYDSLEEAIADRRDHISTTVSDSFLIIEWDEVWYEDETGICECWDCQEGGLYYDI